MKKRVLSLLLCLVMCLSMLPTSALADALDLAPGDPVQEDVTVGAAAPTAPAEPVPYADDEGEESEKYVAKIGDTGYSTLDDALWEANDGDTVELLQSVTGNVTTYSDITIDMGGNTITGDVEAIESLTLNNGVIKGTLKMDCYGGSLVANGVAINGELNVTSGNASVSGAAVGVTGELVIATNSEVTISGTEKAVMLDNAASNGSVIINLYSNGVEATYENGTYTVNGEVAKGLTTVVPSGGETSSASLSISPRTETIHPLGGSATFTVTYDGTDDLKAYVQKSAVDSTIDASIAHTSGNTWTLTVTTTAEVMPATYQVIVQEAKNALVSDIVKVTVSDHNIVDGKCTICNTEFAARCDSVYFATFNDALTYVDSHPNCTIQLLKEITAKNTRDLDLNTAFTLDLNGFTMSYALRVFNNLTIVDNSTDHNGLVLWIDLCNGGSLTVTSGNVEMLNVYGGSATLSGDQSKDVDITAYGGSVVINQCTYSGNVQLKTTEGEEEDENSEEIIYYTGGTITVTDGTFNGAVKLYSIGGLTISSATFNGTVVAESGEDGYYADTKTLAGVLADGCAFYDTATGEIRSADVTELSKVEVKSHEHSFDSSTGKCACGVSAFAMVTTADGVTTLYDTFYDARDFAVQNNGCTLKLLQDYISYDTIRIYEGCSFTLDCTGHVFQPSLTIDSVANVKIAGGTFDRNLVATGRTLADIIPFGLTLFYDNGSNRFVDMTASRVTGPVKVIEAPIKDVTLSKSPNSTSIEHGTELTLSAKLERSAAFKNFGVTYVEWYYATQNADGSWSEYVQFTDDSDTSDYKYSTSSLDIGKYRFTVKAVFYNSGNGLNYSTWAPLPCFIEVMTAKAEYTSLPKAVDGLTYNGNAQALVSGGETSDGTIVYSLTNNGEDWSPEIPKATNAGTYTVYYKIVPDANHSGTNVSSLEVTIARKTVTIQKIIVENADNIVYTGRKLEPAFTVFLSGTDILAATQYDVTYSNNINATTSSALAGITITPKADGNYVFDAYTAEFKIKKATITLKTDTYELDDLLYNDRYIHTLHPDEAFFSTLFDVNSYPTAVETASGFGITNNIGFVSASYISNFKAIDYRINNSDGDLSATPGQECSFDLTIGFDNYNPITITCTLTALDLPTPEISASDITVTYTGEFVPASAANAKATVDGTDIPGTWSWKGDAKPTNVKDTNTYVLVFTPNDTAKYRNAEKAIGITIEPAKITGFNIEVNTPLTYRRDGVKLFDDYLTITGQPDGTTVHYLANDSLMNPYYVDKVDSLSAFIGVGSRTVYYKVSGDNYETLTGSFTFTIEKAMPEIISTTPYTMPLFFTGEQIKNPTEDNLPLRIAKYSDIERFDWYTATKQGNDYVKGTALSGAPTDAGDYWLDVVFKESDTTKAATIGFGLTVKPQTDEQTVNPDAYTVYANRAHTYEVDLSSYLSNLRLGSNVAYQLVNSAGFPPYFLEEGKSVTLSGTTLTIPMASKTNTPLPSIIYELVIWVKSSNYSQITLSLPIQLDAKPTKALDVTMPDWTYGTIGTATYYISGTKQTPEGNVKLSYFDKNGVLLQQYPTEVGTYSVQVLVENDTTIYVGTTSFEILPRNIKDVSVTLAHNTLTYNGDEQKIEITSVQDGRFELDSRHYEIVKDTNVGTDAGTYKMTIRGKGNYTGAATIDWTIAPKELKNPTIVVAAGSTYNGKQQTPAVTVYDGEAIEANLIPDTEYTVEYGKNVDAGTAAGTITLKDNANGNYTISGSATFDIAKAALPGNFVYAYTLPALIYNNREKHTSVVNGSTYASAFHFPQNALPSVVLGGVTGNINVEAKYSTLSYALKDGAAAGDTYTFELTYSFPDYVDATVTFKLPVIDRAAPTVTPDEITMVYTGSAVPVKKITGTAKVGEAVISGTWSWADGVTAPTNVSESGEYDVTFTPSDEVNYKPASAKVKVTITPVSIADAVITLDGTQLVYNRAEQEKGITAVKAGAFTLTAGDYTVTGSKATDAGTHTLTLTGKGNFKDSASTTWTIAPKSVTNPTIEIAPGSTYDGSAQKPAVTVKDGDDVIPASEYTVSYSGNVNAGENTATVTITDNENGNYTVSGSAAFSIAKAAHTITASDLTAVYGQTDCVIQPTGTFGDVNYAVKSGADVAAVDENGALRLLRSGAAVITVSDTGDENHLAAALDVSVTVSKANVTITAMDKSTFTSDKVPDLSNPKDGEDYTVSGLIGEDTLDVTVVLSYDETPNMNKTGTYAIIPSVSGEDARYSFTFENGTLEIKQRPVSPKPTYPVTVISDENGETKSSVSIALKDQTVTITTTPKNGYTLSAVFVTDANGRQLPLTDLGNGCFSFTMPASKVTVRATYRKLQSTSFKDVLPGAYYYDAVQWAVDSSITTGVGNDLFDPNGICTRAQIITFLWRAAGCPEPETTVNPFNDVKPGDYYYKAVLWAVETGITKGISAGQFRPNDSCTRAQAVTFLFRAFGTKTNAVSAFRDVSQNAYYAPAVNWAVKDGVTNGTAPALFSPDTTCTRAQIVTFLYRAFKTR